MSSVAADTVAAPASPPILDRKPSRTTLLLFLPTVIYTRSLPPHLAVVYSGALNFLGVLVSSGAVAGMGLIMLILIGTVPMAYALNRAMPASQMTPSIAMASTTQRSLRQYAGSALPDDPRARGTLSIYIRTDSFNASVVPALAALTGSIAAQVKSKERHQRP